MKKREAKLPFFVIGMQRSQMTLKHRIGFLDNKLR